jgi:hypothetical protein
MEHQFDIILAQLNTIHANQRVMISMLQHITAQENKMAVSLSALTAEVANNTTVTGSVVTLLNNLTAIIKAIPPSSDPATQAALDALTATIAANDAAVAAAVTSNTPAA